MTYVFIHIPKTAGMSIIVRMFDVVDKVGYNKYVFCYHELFLNDEDNIDLSKIGIRKISGDVEFIAVVRNPYDRFVSAYKYLLLGANSDHNKDDQIPVDIVRSMSVSEFFERLPELKMKMIHFLPQHYFVVVDGEIKVDHLIKFENLQEELIQFSEDFVDLPYVNDRKDYEIELTEEQKEIIYREYREDFELFGYDK